MREYTNTGNKDTRSGFGEGLTELGRNNKKIVALCADLTGSLKMNDFKANHPERFFQVGVAEANMIGIAAGMTIGGKIPFTGTFANFSTSRVYDQIRQSIAYSDKNVKICASHAGLTLGEDGATHQILEAKNLKVVSTFQTDFPEYDRLLAFIPLKTAQSIFGMENQATGLICNVKNPHKIEETDIILADAVGLFPYMTTTWKDRHASLLDWLNIYDVPIKLIMIFITIVGIFNIGASLWMIIIEKTTDFGILQSMGLSRVLITEIILKEGAIIGVLGSIFGIIFSLIVLLLESEYHFIRLPNDIYFMDYLPVDIAPEYFFVYPFIALIITLLFSYLPAKKAANISASEALRYE